MVGGVAIGASRAWQNNFHHGLADYSSRAAETASVETHWLTVAHVNERVTGTWSLPVISSLISLVREWCHNCCSRSWSSCALRPTNFMHSTLTHKVCFTARHRCVVSHVTFTCVAYFKQKSSTIAYFQNNKPTISYLVIYLKTFCRKAKMA